MNPGVAGPRLTGVVPPLLTPLTLDGDLDRVSLERLVAHLLEAGVDGIFALGSSGEVAFFDDRCRAEVLAAVVETVAGRVPVLAGVIDMQTSRVLQHVRAAESAGVQGIVATAPFYAITGPDEIETHFRTLAAATDLPVFAYDIPVCVHTKLSADLLVTLGADGVLAGVKDSSGDDVGFRRLVALNRAQGSPLSLLTGHEVVVDGAYLAGADGVVPGLGNVDPAGYVRLHRAAAAGDWESARLEQDRLAALFEIVFEPSDKVGPAAGVGAFKTALRELGVLSTNVMSAPMAAIEGPAVGRIRERLVTAGLL
ncbi:dihydrodipicolinate synthase family protein [Aestuariimicrobium soli]|uniref:dihydrodipicolinate synthase family protein n=1 Tax=Aestuariimicrobium soli TaxID=2035834 RepID=UPI003EBA36DB